MRFEFQAHNSHLLYNIFISTYNHIFIYILYYFQRLNNQTTTREYIDQKIA